MIKNLYLALIHHPVKNKQGEEVTSAVTNLDIHDISRTSKCYGVSRFGIITPIKPQQQMVARVTRHWKRGHGAKYNPTRKDAVELVEVYPSLEEFLAQIEQQHGEKPIVVGTSAKEHSNSRSYEEVTQLISRGNRPIVLAFGTGWGLTLEGFQAIDFALLPVKSYCSDYNHLSVRAAAAIILDRLLGDREETRGLNESS
ncbi:RNA methyltransferase [Bdellovibrionota bacterium]